MSAEHHNQIEELAGNWLARRDSSNWTDQDQRDFERWLAESPLHRVAYLRIEHVWERSKRLAVLGAGRSSLDSGAGDIDSSVAAGRRRWLPALAAGMLLAVAVTLSTPFWPSGSHYRTPVGGMASVPMPDGSTVTLNTDSEIRVALTDVERRIELEQGEAFFEVARDPARPFVVHAGNRRVIAVGTKFSVRRNASDIQIVVTEGKVKVESTGSNPVGLTEPLVAGTIARASDAGVLLQTRPLAEAEESLSWRQGVLVFRRMTLADASAEFNRYNTRKIVIADSSIGALHVAGSFRANNVEAFVRLLERGYPLQVEERDNTLVLVAR